MKISELLRGAAALLEDSHIPSSRRTAEVLLSHCLGRERTFLYTHPEHEVGTADTDRFISIVGRRARREPLQYITGVQEFYGRRFMVNPDVLIPRPETELIVQTALELNRWGEPRILDVGTGSGCIAASLALELPRASVWASDISSEAIATARENAQLNQARIHLACMDLVDGWKGPFEIVVSNPPYISAGERDGLQVEVREYEPHVALFPELAPAALYGRLLRGAADLLVPGGCLILEIGYSMEAEIRSLFDDQWSDLVMRPDLQGFPRVLTARKAPARPTSGAARSGQDP